MDRLDGSGYNAAVESFREQEYPMLRGTHQLRAVFSLWVTLD